LPVRCRTEEFCCPLNQHIGEEKTMTPLEAPVIRTFREAARLLTGPRRRRFQAQVTLDYLDGSPRSAERIFGWGRSTVDLGLHKLRTGITCQDALSVRGRMRVELQHPEIVDRLEELLANDIAGSPMSEEKWVRASLSRLSQQLEETGYQVGTHTVARILRDMGYSRKSNKRKQPKPKCPLRNKQFEYIALQRQSFPSAGLPVISVDTKKKELVGPFRNPGQTWCREADEVNEHDFPIAAECQVVPFGIYDIMKNTGYVVVGISNNTPEFGVNSIGQWWDAEGRDNYPAAKQLLILADCGGGNGSSVGFRNYT
jgi:transposase